MPQFTNMYTKQGVLITSGIYVIIGFLTFKLLKFCFWPQTRVKRSIHVCSSSSEWNCIESTFLQNVSTAKVIGLDCEWVTEDDERNPVSLLQLATVNEVCFLIRLCCFSKEPLPKTLVNLLKDDKVLKVGVNVIDDAQKLENDYGLEVRGCFDLRHLVRNRPEFKEIWDRGLRVLAQKVLNIDIVKSVDISCSNWEAEKLNLEQVTYAADDAIVSIKIFETLSHRGRKMWMHYFPLKLEMNEEIKNFIDIPYKNSNHHHRIENFKTHCRPLTVHKTNKASAQARKKPNYENCMILAPDNEPLCTCDRRKACWYLDRGLGEVVQEEEPFIVRLNFEPSGRPVLDNFYYIQEKRGGCVVCGNTDCIFRKTVVPHEYRRHFPALMKKNLSHDVLLLCVECHRLSNVLYRELRDQLARECFAPIGTGDDVKQKADAKLCRVKYAARVILKSNSEIPVEKKEQLMKIIQEHFGVEEVSDDLLKSATRINTITTNDSYNPHGLKVYQHMCINGGLLAFEKRWRQHFLDGMKPQFLPEMWSVDHNHDRLALQVLQRPMNFDVSILGITDDQFHRVEKLWSLHAT